MISSLDLPCDGCGRSASTEHIARRLQRLKWTTWYRPVHIHTLFLGSASPQKQEEFLYSPNGEFQGEAGTLLAAAGLVLPALMEHRLTAVAVRIRRSLKPKRVVLISRALETILERFRSLQLGCPLVLDDGKPFALDGSDTQKVAARLSRAVGASPD